MKWISNPKGAIKKVIGEIFIIVGLVVIFGIDKQIQALVLDQGLHDPVMGIEELLRRN